MTNESKLPDDVAEDVWQPIETIPRGGPPLLLWTASTREYHTVARVKSIHGPGWRTSEGFQVHNATHWTYLPAPPHGESKT